MSSIITTQDTSFCHSCYSTSGNFEMYNLDPFLWPKLSDDVLHLDRIPIKSNACAQLPMNENRREGGCARLFFGGIRAGTAISVVQALIEYADADSAYPNDPIKVVAVNHCKPHFCITCPSEEAAAAVGAFLQEQGHQVVLDRCGYVVQMFIASYNEAVTVEKDMFDLLRPLGMYNFSIACIKKKTGGLRLTLSQDHAQRLLKLCVVQDTDRHLIVAKTENGQWILNDFLKALRRERGALDFARFSCTPMRLISVEVVRN